MNKAQSISATFLQDATAILQLQSIHLTLAGHEIIRGVDLSIRPGEFICVVGPSGCGKTTLLRFLAGLYEPSGGRVFYRGKKIGKPRQGHRNCLSRLWQGLAALANSSWKRRTRS